MDNYVNFEDFRKEQKSVNLKRSSSGKPINAKKLL